MGAHRELGSKGEQVSTRDGGESEKPVPGKSLGGSREQKEVPEGETAAAPGSKEGHP